MALIRPPSPRAVPPRPAALVAALATLLAVGLASTLGVGAALAQDAGLRPTATPDDAAPPADGDPLRGGMPGLDGGEAAQPQAPAAPDSAPEAPVRRQAAGQGSALAAPRAGPPRLPALQAYPSSLRLPRGAAVDTIDPATGPALDAAPLSSAPLAAAPTVAALPVPTPLRRKAAAAADPLAPLGTTIGSLRLTPYVEESLGYDSNPEQISTGVKPSAFSRTEGGFGLLSQWSSNELRSAMHAGYDAFFSNPEANRPDAAGTIDYRYDLSREWVLDAEGRFAVSTQRPGSPEVNVAVLGRPLIDSYGATLGATETLGRLSLGLHGLIDRTEYENGRLGDGSTVAFSTQNFNDYGLALRADYELTPTLKPFGEVTLDTRQHDVAVDYTGYARNSDGILGRLGSTFELTPLLTGTVSGGYETRSYADKRLEDLRGPVVDASVAYAVTPLTTLTLLASTSFDETDLAGSPGAESRSVSLQVSHALLRNLTLSGVFGYLNTDYVASTIRENTYSATLKADYAISRNFVLQASYNHQTLVSTDPGSSFTQDVFLLGLRVQQ